MDLKINPNINPESKRDIEELADRIEKFRNEEIDEDRFESRQDDPHEIQRDADGQKQQHEHIASVWRADDPYQAALW